jgi:hypothetical protein
MPSDEAPGPTGLLGVSWGEDAEAAAAKLGLACARWTPWEGGQGFDSCFDIDHPVDVFGHKSLVRLFRRDRLLQALSFRFLHCGGIREALTKSVGIEFQMTTGQDTPYKVFENGTVVRLDYDSGDDTCRLTLTGSEFGKAFAGYLLGSGLGDFAAGFRPR